MGPRLLEENCENPEFCLVYEEEEIIDEADQKAIYVEEEMGCVMVGDASYEFDRWFAAHDREVAEKAWDEGFMRANRLVNCRMCRGTTVPKINPYTV